MLANDQLDTIFLYVTESCDGKVESNRTRNRFGNWRSLSVDRYLSIARFDGLYHFVYRDPYQSIPKIGFASRKKIDDTPLDEWVSNGKQFVDMCVRHTNIDITWYVRRHINIRPIEFFTEYQKAQLLRRKI